MSRASILGITIFVLNLAINGPEYVNYQWGPVPYFGEAGRLAHSLVERGSYENPFAPMDTGPSAHMPPGLPILIAAVIKTLGAGVLGWTVIKLLAASAVSLQLALLPFLAERLGLSLIAGVAGALIGIAAPLRHFPEWDANYTGLLLLTVTLVSARVWRMGRLTLGQACMVGWLWGTVFYFNAATLVLFGVWMLAMAWATSRSLSLRAAIRTWCRLPHVAYLVLPLVMIAPWTVRNYVVFGELFFMRHNLGLELAVSNNDCAKFGLRDNISTSCFGQWHPDLSLEQAKRMAELGESAYHKEKLEAALAWIRTHPGAFARLVGHRALEFWFPTESGNPTADYVPPGRWYRRYYPLVGLASLLSLAGLWQLYRVNPLGGWLLGGWMALFPVTYYMVQAENRYRYPILWITLLLAGQCVSRVLVDRAQTTRERTG